MILIGRAHCQSVITYTELSLLVLHKKAPRSRAMRLGQLFSYCDQRNLSHLSAIVVEKKTLKPAPDAPYDSRILSRMYQIACINERFIANALSEA